MRRAIALAVLALATISCDWFESKERSVATAESSSVSDCQPLLTRYTFEPKATDRREALARCLTERGAIIYSTPWCGACRRQKELFGSYAELLNQVDCTQERQRCQEARIRAVPTWVFSDGTRHEGILSLRELARRAGCPWR